MNTAPFEERLLKILREKSIPVSEPVYRNTPESSLAVLFEDPDSLSRFSGKNIPASKDPQYYFVRKWKAENMHIDVEYLLQIQHNREMLGNSDPTELEKAIQMAVSRGKVRETCNLFLKYPYAAVRGEKRPKNKRDMVIIIGTMGGKFRSRGPYDHQNKDGSYNPDKMAEVIGSMINKHFEVVEGN